MDREWVDEKLSLLSMRLKNFRAGSSVFYFEPTEDVYQMLESGDENDLRKVAVEMGKHIGVIVAPTVTYDWGLKMEPTIAGRIKSASQMPLIQIPFFYVGKKYAVAGILSHEMTHALLYQNGIWLNDPDENEAFTDLTAVFVGLGKLLLNGYIGEDFVLGYLSPELIAYSYKKISTSRMINRDTAMKNLTTIAKNSY